MTTKKTTGQGRHLFMTVRPYYKYKVGSKQTLKKTSVTWFIIYEISSLCDTLKEEEVAL